MSVAFDMERDEIAVEQCRQREGEARLAGTRAPSWSRCASARREVERLAKIVATGEERCGVAVGSHAEHDGIERPEFAAAPLHSRRAARSAPSRPSFCRRCSRTSRALERSLGLVHAAFIDQRDGDRSQSIGCAPGCRRSSFGVLPPETASMRIGRDRRWRPTGSAATSAARAAASVLLGGEQLSLGNQFASSSCQVRPSRSISATAAAGPQVPAV